MIGPMRTQKMLSKQKNRLKKSRFNYAILFTDDRFYKRGLQIGI